MPRKWSQLVLCGFATCPLLVSATHYRGGEIRYAHVSGLTWVFEPRLYYNSSEPPDQPDLLLYFGDGSSAIAPAVDEETFLTSCGDEMRSYLVEHTYAAPGEYTVELRIYNRTPGIVNIPGSLSIPLCIASTLVVTVDGGNSSPVFNNHLPFIYYNGVVLTHELQPTDAEGDSLSFEMVVPLGADGSDTDPFGDPIIGYLYPDEYLPGPNNQISLDPIIGTMNWNAPQQIGLYTVALRCTEWRNGVFLGSVTRDMTMCVTIPFTAMDATSGELVFDGWLDGELLRVRLPQWGTLDIRILDGQGRCVRSSLIDALEGSVTVHGLQNGAYTLILRRGAGSIARQFVLVR